MDPHTLTRKFRRELAAGTMGLAVLALIVRSKRPLYGYEVAKTLEEHAHGQLPINHGALYPVLRGLEKNGLLTSEILPSDQGPPRKYYQATPQGRKSLKEWQKVWKTTQQMVNSVLGDTP